jgi:putative transposase
VCFYSPKAFGSTGDWLHQREKRNRCCAAVWWVETKFQGERLWARGYAVSTVGFELDQVKEYIRNQSNRDKDDHDDG